MSKFKTKKQLQKELTESKEKIVELSETLESVNDPDKLKETAELQKEIEENQKLIKAPEEKIETAYSSIRGESGVTPALTEEELTKAKQNIKTILKG